MYDYKEGKKRVIDILDSKIEVIDQDKVPGKKEFTFDNGYNAWVTAVFVDIRDSTSIFTQKKKTAVSKMIRAFTSEIIEILKESENLREIGIRGDCVYAIYTCSQKEEDFDVFIKTWYVLSYLKMLNILLQKRNFPKIIVGIGIATSKDLVVKAGRENTGVNAKVWIGESVTYASYFSSLGNKNDYKSIVISEFFHDTIIDIFVHKQGEKVKNWFDMYTIKDYGNIYDCEISSKKFDEWIKKGMK